MQTAEVTIGKDDLAARLAEMRAWLDEKRFEPPIFRFIHRTGTLLVRVSFKIDDEARAFAAKFGGSVAPRSRSPLTAAYLDDDRGAIGASRPRDHSVSIPVGGGKSDKAG